MHFLCLIIYSIYPSFSFVIKSVVVWLISTECSQSNLENDSLAVLEVASECLERCGKKATLQKKTNVYQVEIQTSKLVLFEE